MLRGLKIFKNFTQRIKQVDKVIFSDDESFDPEFLAQIEGKESIMKNNLTEDELIAEIS